MSEARKKNYRQNFVSKSTEVFSLLSALDYFKDIAKYLSQSKETTTIGWF